MIFSFLGIHSSIRKESYSCGIIIIIFSMKINRFYRHLLLGFELIKRNSNSLRFSKMLTCLQDLTALKMHLEVGF